MKLLPLGEMILIEPIVDQPKGGLIKAETVEGKRADKGRVLSVGSKYDGELKKGDTVYFQKYEVEEIILDGKTFVIGAPAAMYCKVK